MKEFLLVAAFLAAWIVLNRWVLPWFGVATCMSGACRVEPPLRKESAGKDVQRDR